MTIDQQQARFNKAIVGCADEMVRILVDPEQLIPVACPDCKATNGRAVQHPMAKGQTVCGCCSGAKYVYFPAVLLVGQSPFARAV